MLEDALLHIGQPVVIGIEQARRLGNVEPVLGLHTPRQLEHGVEPGADPARLGALLAGALQLVDLTLHGHPDMLGQVALGQLGSIVVGIRSVTLAVTELPQLLADGLELTPQQELALGLLHALFDIGLDALAQGQLGQRVAGPAQDQAQPVLDVDRFEHLDLLRQRQVGRVPRHVGQPAGLGHLAQLVGDPARAPAQQDVLEDGAVLPGQGHGRLAGLTLVERLRLHPQGGPRPGHPGADDGPLCPRDGHRGQPARQLPLLHHLGDHAHAGVLPLDVRHEEQPPPGRSGRLDGSPGLVRLEGHGEDHAGQHHARSEREERECHVLVRHGHPSGL